LGRKRKIYSRFGARLARFFLGPNIPQQKKYTKRPQTIPKGSKLYQKAVPKLYQMAQNIPKGNKI
jgi:hypothetical protein